MNDTDKKAEGKPDEAAAPAKKDVVVKVEPLSATGKGRD